MWKKEIARRIRETIPGVEVEEVGEQVLCFKVPSVRYPNGKPFCFYLIRRDNGEYTVTDLGDIYFELEDVLPYSLHRSFEASTIRYDHTTLKEVPQKVCELLSVAEYFISVAEKGS